MKYKVRAFEIWLTFSRQLVLLALTSVLFVGVVSFLINGYQPEVIFKNISPLEYLYLLIGIIFFCIAISAIVAPFFKLSSIEIENGTLIGRDYYGRKKTIQFGSIKSISPFQVYGINATIIDAGELGQVYIYQSTERYSEIISLIRASVPFKISNA
ncbi:hypothetical protein [Microbulbifer agarilyticus]|uniref:hypothetical protein n=1 Tax=Microbulbifer agarilyticus TaxID=260552 RepID=UPI001CD5879F|nr:hypothetical protein [Microbulbifer agarilyticus]MCA0893082.1 hypothetical protein [Microbulbifer agarilyticus]